LKKKSLSFLSVLILLFSCEDQIVSECEEQETITGVTATFSSIQSEVFDTNCATAGCHITNSIDPVLSAGVSYNNIVNVMSFNPPFPYVYPARSDSSYLINKIRGINMQGERMPLNRPALSETVIDSIAAWIDRGALNN
jgi:hypothetical protein